MQNEVIWSTSINKIFEDINDYKNRFSIPKGLTKQEFIEIKEEVRSLIQKYTPYTLNDKKIFLTGHQSEIFHPGIIFKDIILFYLSKNFDAVPVHVIVDTDAFEFSYYFPEIFDNHLVLKKYDSVSESIYLYEQYNEKESTILKNILNEQKNILPNILRADVLKIATTYIDYIVELIQKKKSLHEISISILKKFFTDSSLGIIMIPQSEIISLEGFSKFIEVISKRHEEFIEIHNDSLNSYRKIHKIKNHAQPLPEMRAGELPFWELDEDTGRREHAEFPLTQKKYIPRAITNTMFFRIFFSDLFIHGRGGSRYEQISDEIIRKFFQIHPSPYYIASANLYLQPVSQYPIGEYTSLEFQQIERDLQYSPEKFLDENDSLLIQKKELLQKFKEQNTDKKILNHEKEVLNKKIQEKIQDKVIYFDTIKKNLKSHESNRESFFNRTYPFFYYDLQFLFQEAGRLLSDDTEKLILK